MTGTATLGEITASLCPVCLNRIAARRVNRQGRIYLEKKCPDHGEFQALIWREPPEMASWRRPKIAVHPEDSDRASQKGCPFDCGLCSDHRQKTCTLVLEVTRRCNLGCTFCFADACCDAHDIDPAQEVIAGWYRTAAGWSSTCNLQLSGGEPTVREDLPDLIAMGRDMGFNFIQINTNGLRLANEPGYADALRQAGAASIFLQFDGLDDKIYQRLRGRSLWAEKQAVIKACSRAGLGVVLVPTLVPGCNVDTVGGILEFALKHYPTVRGVHFQPVSYFGRHSGRPTDDQRLTLPELMQAMEIQSRGLFKADHFRPPGCEHSLCSISSQYLIQKNGEPRPLHTNGDVWRKELPIPAEEGAARTVASVARQWSAAESGVQAFSMERCTCRTRARCGDGTSNLSLDDFLEMARSSTFSVSAMAFQDVWNLDLERVQQCCIHVMAPDGRRIPFCLYNLTAADGRPLYRK